MQGREAPGKLADCPSLGLGEEAARDKTECCETALVLTCSVNSTTVSGLRKTLLRPLASDRTGSHEGAFSLILRVRKVGVNSNLVVPRTCEGKKGGYNPGVSKLASDFLGHLANSQIPGPPSLLALSPGGRHGHCGQRAGGQVSGSRFLCAACCCWRSTSHSGGRGVTGLPVQLQTEGMQSTF